MPQLHKHRNVGGKFDSTVSILKKYFRHILFLLSLLVGQIAFCQTKDVLRGNAQKGISVTVSKRNVEAIIERSINQPDKGKISFPSNPWTACNQDSTFYTKDTVYFCTNSYYTSTNAYCCAFISWTFYDINAFIRMQEQTCNEPSSAKGYNENDNFKIELTEKDNLVFIRTYNKQKLVDNFKIVSIERLKKDNGTEEFYIVRLVRQR